MSFVLPRTVGSVAFRRPALRRTLAKLVSRLTCRFGMWRAPYSDKPTPFRGGYLTELRSRPLGLASASPHNKSDRPPNKAPGPQRTNDNHGVSLMKTYRVSRLYRWSRAGAKVILTAGAGLLYIVAVTHPTPLAFRLLLLAGMALFGWLFYVRLPKMPTEITVTDDGWVNFQSSRGTTRVQAADIQSIGPSLGRRTLRVQYSGGQVRLPNRFRRSFDFLLTVKGLNPAVDIRGF